MTAVNLATVDRDQLVTALARWRADAVDVSLVPPADSGGLNVWMLIVGDTPIFPLAMLTRRRRDYTVSADRLRAAASSCVGAVTVADDDGALVLADADHAITVSDPPTPSPPAARPAPAPTPVPEAPMPVTPQIKPLSSYTPACAPSPAYAVVDALIALSEAIYGGAIVQDDPVRQMWDIRVGKAVGYRVSAQTLATVITAHACVRGTWIAVETRRYPPLGIAERGRLFYFRNVKG